MRIGILGGTFDPPHKGHLALAHAAVHQLALDQLIFVPAFQPPLKHGQNLTDVSHRFEMVRRAIAEKPKFHISDCEITGGGIAYTVDTLREFRKQCPKPHELFFITGGDWGQNLEKWKEIDAIFSLAHFIVARRPGFNLKPLPEEVEFLDFVPLDISATQIRECWKREEDVSSMVPIAVIDYIRSHQLYRK